MDNVSTLTVVIPCFNEEDSLPVVLSELLDFANERNWKVIVTNDASTDNTEKILKNYSGVKNFKYITHKINRGYGGALKTAINNVDTEFLVSIDADGQHYLEDIDVLLKKLKEKNADMVIGSRKDIRSTSAYRSSGKWIIRKISKMLVKTDIYDINSGMKICRTELAKNYLNLLPDSMAFSDIMTLIFSAQKNHVIEEPIKIKERIAGKSTIGLNTAFDTVMEVLNIVMLFNPIKIFLPVSIVFILLGIGWGLPIIFAGRGVSVGAAMLIIMGVMTFLLGLIAEQLSLLRKKS